MKNQNGITLIALVITIIVLIILAGVAIAMLSGDNGILSRASQAAEDSKKGALAEAAKIAVGEIYTEDYADSGAPDFVAKSGTLLKKIIDANDSVSDAKITNSETMTSDKYVTITSEKQGQTVYVRKDGKISETVPSVDDLT